MLRKVVGSVFPSFRLIWPREVCKTNPGWSSCERKQLSRPLEIATDFFLLCQRDRRRPFIASLNIQPFSSLEKIISSTRTHALTRENVFLCERKMFLLSPREINWQGNPGLALLFPDLALRAVGWVNEEFCSEISLEPYVPWIFYVAIVNVL